MKNLFTFFAAILFTGILFAQSPQKMSYQAVIRDASNKLVVNHQVGMQISIVQSSEDGTVVYTETQTPTTNANGLVSIKIGDGADFASIDWANGPYFIKTETDPAGGTSYSITGVSQLLSVPYALYAEKSGSPGPQGEKGDKGEKGDQGPRGIQGYDGANGLTTSVNGVTQINGAITLTKSDLGLGNVDNTSDTNKPISSDTQTALNMKVEKETGKGLSTEDYSTAEKTKLDGIAPQAEVNVQANWDETDDTKDSYIKNKPNLFTNSDETDPIYSASEAASITNAGSGVVISNAERYKLSGIASGAEVNVNADWNALSGDAQILNKPTLFSTSDETDPVYSASEAASITDAGSGVVISSAERYKLSGIAENANVGVVPNAVITAATKTKITYDSKGLVTAGTDATTADIAASTDKNYVTDAQKTVIGNTSGTNTGDNSPNTLYSSLISNAIHTGDAEGATTLTVKQINGVALSSLATGILKNTTTTGKPSIAVANDFPILNQNTTGTAANVTGTVAIANGGTGATTATNAINALLPAQTGNSGKYLTTNGSTPSWTAATGAVTNVTGTAPISVATGTTTPLISIAAATTSAAGSMSAADKTKLDGSTHAIGDNYGGGIVFFVYDGGRHGLIAAKNDQSTGIAWKNYWDRVTGATGDGLNAGAMNTAIIVAGQMNDDQSGNFAAKVCADYSVTDGDVTYGDWYLPSLFELHQMWLNIGPVGQNIGGFSTGSRYWSSTENSDSPSNTACYVVFTNNGYLQSNRSKNDLCYVRAIRSF